MDLQTISDLYGRHVARWPEFAQREGVRELIKSDCQWLCDAFDEFTPEQLKRMLDALLEDNTAARLIALGTVLDELLSAPMLHDELQRRIDMAWGGWRRDRQDGSAYP